MKTKAQMEAERLAEDKLALEAKGRQNIAEIQELSTPIKNITFSGGGAKGAIYSGVYRALVDAGTMESVDTVSGSSAGALISGLIATGTKPEKVADIMKGDFKALLGNSSGTLGSIMTLGYGWRDGQPIYNLLNDTIKNSIKDFLRGKTLEDLQEKRNINRTAEMKDISVRLADINGRLEDINQPPQEQERTTLNNNKTNLLGKLDSLIESMNVDIDSKDFEELVKATEDQTKTISFKHHKLLNLLAPETFKKLIITAVEEKTGKLKIFSADETPDVEIALACRASAALPLALMPTVIDGVSYIDGGYRDNIPTNYNDQKNVIAPLKTELDNVLKERQEGRTLTFAFVDNENRANFDAVYKNPNTLPNTSIIGQITTTLEDVFVKSTSWMKSNHTYAEDQTNTLDNLQKRALDVVLLDTKHIGTRSFKEATKEAAYLDMKGNFTTLSYLKNHNLPIEHSKNLSYQEFFVDAYEHQAKIRGAGSKMLKAQSKYKNELVNLYQEAEKGKDGKELLINCFLKADEYDAMKFKDNKASQQQVLVDLINIPTEQNTLKETVAKILGQPYTSKFQVTLKDVKSIVEQKKIFESLKPIAKGIVKEEIIKSQNNIAVNPAKLNMRRGVMGNQR